MRGPTNHASDHSEATDSNEVTAAVVSRTSERHLDILLDLLRAMTRVLLKGRGEVERVADTFEMVQLNTIFAQLSVLFVDREGEIDAILKGGVREVLR
jgi:hypothetical protein